MEQECQDMVHDVLSCDKITKIPGENQHFCNYTPMDENL